MRDADDDEETRVFSAGTDAPRLSPSAPARAEGLPPPRVEDESVVVERVLAAESALTSESAVTESALTPGRLSASDDDDATRLMPATPAANPQKWLVSDGPNAPMDLSHTDLCAALKSGKVSRAALAWKKGMREWQNVAEIPTLSSALTSLSTPAPRPAPPPRSSPRSSPPPKRNSRPRREPSAPRQSKPSKSAPELSPKIDAKIDTEADTPPSGSVLLSASVSTADFSEITPAHTPHSQRAQLLATHSAAPKPERIEIEPLPALSARPGTSDSLTKPKPSIHTPRPAAGRPPAPGEPVAKTPEVPDAKVALDAKVVINDPPASVLATGLAQAKLNPTIETQRETTQPARWRPPLHQLRAAGQPPNVVLWVLGAGGWVLAGVLAGLLIAKNEPEPALVSTTPTTITTHASVTHEPGDRARRAAARPAPALAATSEAPATPEALATPDAVAAADLAAPPASGTNGAARPAKPVAQKPPVVAAVKPATADPSGLSGPTTTKDINTPGF